MLFDLINDPIQTKNVLERNEDVAKMLHGELMTFLQSIGAPEEKIARYET